MGAQGDASTGLGDTRTPLSPPQPTQRAKNFTKHPFLPAKHPRAAPGPVTQTQPLSGLGSLRILLFVFRKRRVGFETAKACVYLCFSPKTNQKSVASGSSSRTICWLCRGRQIPKEPPASCWGFNGGTLGFHPQASAVRREEGKEPLQNYRFGRLVNIRVVEKHRFWWTSRI